jgi:hypothetical protein
MTRYRDSLKIMGGCRLVVTPLGSKLITLGVGLAALRCARSRSRPNTELPYRIRNRLATTVTAAALKESNPNICCLLLTGEAYDNAPGQLDKPGFSSKEDTG